MKFEEEIDNFIQKKCEGSYWDFKQQWYDSKQQGELLHDIICMANNQTEHDAFIIIGVEDESFKIVGISEDDPNRRNTADLQNFLRGKKFAGDVRPSVKVISINLQGKIIDVIQIENCNRTPFYLIERYKDVKENSIYVRNEDSNTPIDKTADPDKIENLWRKRFGIGLTAIDRFGVLIKEKDKWKKSPYLPEQSPYIETWYHEIFPEFTIKISNDERGDAQELYMCEFPNSTPYWMNICVCYHNTVLKFFKGVGLDGLQYNVIAPCSYAVQDHEIEGYPLMLHYYIMDSLDVDISNVLGNLSFNSNNPSKSDQILPAKSILYFKNLGEWDLFKEKYLETKNDIEKLTQKDKKEIEEQSINNFFKSNEVQNISKMQVFAKFSLWCQKKLTEFRDSNSEHS